jgi:hypothetical protein
VPQRWWLLGGTVVAQQLLTRVRVAKKHGTTLPNGVNACVQDQG